MTEATPIALTIAGLDPSGGAGVIADIRTFVSLGCFPTMALTSITFQNTTGVFGAVHQTAATLRGQLEPVAADLEVAAVKTGMLPTAEIVACVADLIQELKLPLPVVDPVMVSTSGHDLIGPEAFQVLTSRLLPLARLVTPNIPEAERLAGFSIKNEDDMRKAGRAILDQNVSVVLIKGGHLGRQGSGIVDLLMGQDGVELELRSEFVDVGAIHGTGCTLSAAIAANLARGLELLDSVRTAKDFVDRRIHALVNSERIGHGARPL
ncbi:MAG TPA: bifunctional hydroxymethylpyrimidine kinase/phosphomethylpyrimidine kinase [Pyrinomonadaceae bacterium]|nr:bifunctional hydroxymethylpyrimidine kinase/phosphomethylpyrimidine kinase [Pyrinomonadaceae bacterium]